MNSSQEFQQLIQQVTAYIGDLPLDKTLQTKLNQHFPVGGAVYNSIFAACKEGIEQGWMCQHEAGGIRYGRVIKPNPDLNGYSVDVVDMDSCAGPHHAHPNGEIDLIMPLSDTAQFDNHAAGWLVYGPESSHSPTVTQGRALVLYLLPDGKIQFTKT